MKSDGDPRITTVECHSVYGSIYEVGCSPFYLDRHMEHLANTGYEVLGASTYKTVIKSSMTRARLREMLLFYVDYDAWVRAYLRSPAASAPENADKTQNARVWY